MMSLSTLDLRPTLTLKSTCPVNYAIPFKNQCHCSLVLTLKIKASRESFQNHYLQPKLQCHVDLCQVLDAAQGLVYFRCTDNLMAGPCQSTGACDSGLHPLLPRIAKTRPPSCQEPAQPRLFSNFETPISTLRDRAVRIQLLQLQHSQIRRSRATTSSAPSSCPRLASSEVRTKTATAPMPRSTDTQTPNRRPHPSKPAKELSLAPAATQTTCSPWLATDAPQLSLVPPLQTGISDGQTRAAPGVTPTPGRPQDASRDPPTC